MQRKAIRMYGKRDQMVELAEAVFLSLQKWSTGAHFQTRQMTRELSSLFF